MIDPIKEKLLKLSAAARILGKHRDTIHNWIEFGKNGVRLEAVMLPGGLHTSEEAVRRFVAALTNEARVGERDLPASPAAVNRADAEAVEELRRMGIV